MFRDSAKSAQSLICRSYEDVQHIADDSQTSSSQRSSRSKRTEVWFCGPRKLAKAVKEALRRKSRGRTRFFQEAFELR